MKILRGICPAILLLFLLPAGGISAQDRGDEDRAITFSAYAAIGPGLPEWPVLSAGLEVSTPYGLILGRSTNAIESLASFKSKRPVEHNLDVALLYGWRRRLTPHLAASISTGVARAIFVRRGRFLNPGAHLLLSARYETLQREALGIPIELRLYLKDDRGWGGAVLSFSANVNQVESYGGVLFGLYFGK